MSDYTPTTGNVRNRYASGRRILDARDACLTPLGELDAEFDRWLAEHDREKDDRIEKAEAALARVKALHKPEDVEPSETICTGCSTLRGTDESARYFPYEEYPCATIRAIEGEDDE